MRRVFVVALIAVFAASPAAAQIQNPTDPPGPLLRDAFASPYGKVFLVEFEAAVRRDAGAACLKSKGLDSGKVSERAQEIFLRYGTNAMEMVRQNLDLAAYEKRMAASGVSNARAEIEKLKQNPEVKRISDLERPVKLVRAVDFVLEQFDRYVLLNKIKLGSIAVASTGKFDLIKGVDPAEKNEEEIEKLIKESKTPEVKRFAELSEIVAAATLDAFDQKKALEWGPGTFFGGVEKDLAELCVTKQ